jgi:hypothetical protein
MKKHRMKPSAIDLAIVSAQQITAEHFETQPHPEHVSGVVYDAKKMQAHLLADKKQVCKVGDYIVVPLTEGAAPFLVTREAFEAAYEPT